ncbi:MAG: carboxypeptidase-like regulatory domain-containing protein [Candidatus Sericytochromatia bacterium]|nr:carboxypeptidase-like regulatory domain-containing protein [Candidatus Sericytochromatia bacterium]
MKRCLTPLYALLSLGLAPLAAFAEAPPKPSPARPAAGLPATVQGTVVDAASGAPLASVLVQQEGAVSSTFTQADGQFRLLLERAAGATLTVSAVGYEPLSVPVTAGATAPLRLTMTAVSGFIPASPMLAADQLGQGPADLAPLNTGMIFAYRLRQQLLQAGGARAEGWANNDYRVGLRFRLRPLLIEAEGSHHETPVDVSGLDRVANPAFRPSTWQGALRLGLLTPLATPDLEVAALAGYRWSNTVPNNNDIPYTGSDLDWEQTRQAFGPVALLAWRPGRGRFHLETSYGWYPAVWAAAKAPGRPFGSAWLTDLRAVVGYEVVPGMRLGLGYQGDQWGGGGEDSARLFSLQMHYTPGGAPKGFEP